MKYYHVTPKENIHSILEDGIISHSGERSSQIGDSGVFLFPSQADMEDALMNWLGDELEEVEELLYLVIELPEDWEFTSDVEFEVRSNDSISPEYIVDILDEDNNSVYDTYSSTSVSSPTF